jgi:hypothetical protein
MLLSRSAKTREGETHVRDDRVSVVCDFKVDRVERLSLVSVCAVQLRIGRGREKPIAGNAEHRRVSRKAAQRGYFGLGSRCRALPAQQTLKARPPVRDQGLVLALRLRQRTKCGRPPLEIARPPTGTAALSMSHCRPSSKSDQSTMTMGRKFPSNNVRAIAA